MEEDPEFEELVLLESDVSGTRILGCEENTAAATANGEGAEEDVAATTGWKEVSESVERDCESDCDCD